jgi:hypothetical protein
MSQRVAALGVQPQGGSARGYEAGCRHRVAAGEQCDLVPVLHQGFCEVGDDPFGAAVAAGGHRLIEGGDLGNAITHAPLDSLAPRGRRGEARQSSRRQQRPTGLADKRTGARRFACLVQGGGHPAARWPNRRGAVVTRASNEGPDAPGSSHHQRRRPREA